MDEKLSILDFDIIGIIKLKDVDGIEKYVTQIGDETIPGKTEYLSRSKEYYNVKTMSELSETREELKSKATREFTKKNFVILENMLNCSAKVYFRKFETYIESHKDENKRLEMEEAKRCLLEDTSNLIKILQGKGLITINPGLVLPGGRENSERRNIEMDNKSVIYEFSKVLNKLNISPNDYEILTPGYGSLYIGPFLKIMHGFNFNNLLKSKYIAETAGGSEKFTEIKDLVSDTNFLENDKKILILDDNIGTGETMRDIKQMLPEHKKEQCISGAIQFNWRNYYRVFIGEKKDIEKFDVSEFDIISPLNYAGHKLYEHAINELHDSGEVYIKYLNSKSYRNGIFSDIEGSIRRTLKSAQKTGLQLSDKNTHFLNLEKLDKEVTIEDKKLKLSAQIFIDELIDDVYKTISETEEISKNKGEI